MRKKLVNESRPYLWTRRWQKAEEKAVGDIKAAGRVKMFDSTDELTGDLDEK